MDEQNDNTLLNYKVPENILMRIKKEFYIALLGELVSVFGPHILNKIDESTWSDEEREIFCTTDELNEETLESYYNFNSSTCGWSVAFEMTCRKMNMQWLYDYYKNLPTYVESDIFDGVIEANVGKVLDEMKEESHFVNPYYSWLNHTLKG